MGVGASVMCRCYQDGKVALPKFAKAANIDEEGYLNLPFDVDTTLYMQFDRWMNAACAHPKMTLVYENISNWTGYRSFQQALSFAGWEHFPALEAELPQSNDGQTASMAAAKMLDEIDYFREHARLGSTTVLIDSATGHHLHEYIDAYEGLFMHGDDGINLGVDQHGFFIRHRDDIAQRELFRSMKFTQRLITGSKANAGNSHVEYVDLATGDMVQFSHPISQYLPWPDGKVEDAEGKPNLQFPSLMHVAECQRQVSEYEYILEPLRTVCQASVETGNPIRWR